MIWRSSLQAHHLHWDTVSLTGIRASNLFHRCVGPKYFLPEGFQTIFDGCLTWFYAFFLKGEIKIFQCGKIFGIGQSSCLILGKGILFLYGFKDGSNLRFSTAFKLCLKTAAMAPLHLIQNFRVRSFRVSGNKGQGKLILVQTRPP